MTALWYRLKRNVAHCISKDISTRRVEKAICGFIASSRNIHFSRECQKLSRNLRERDNLTLSWCCGRLSAPWSRRPPSRSASASNPSIEDSASLNQAKNLSRDRSKLWSEFIAECSSFPRLMMLETDRSRYSITSVICSLIQGKVSRDGIDANASMRDMLWASQSCRSNYIIFFRLQILEVNLL